MRVDITYTLSEYGGDIARIACAYVTHKGSKSTALRYRKNMQVCWYNIAANCILRVCVRARNCASTRRQHDSSLA